MPPKPPKTKRRKKGLSLDRILQLIAEAQADSEVVGGEKARVVLHNSSGAAHPEGCKKCKVPFDETLLKCPQCGLCCTIDQALRFCQNGGSSTLKQIEQKNKSKEQNNESEEEDSESEEEVIPPGAGQFADGHNYIMLYLLLWVVGNREISVQIYTDEAGNEKIRFSIPKGKGQKARNIDTMQSTEFGIPGQSVGGEAFRAFAEAMQNWKGNRRTSKMFKSGEVKFVALESPVPGVIAFICVAQEEGSLDYIFWDGGLGEPIREQLLDILGSKDKNHTSHGWNQELQPHNQFKEAPELSVQYKIWRDLSRQVPATFIESVPMLAKPPYNKDEGTYVVGPDYAWILFVNGVPPEFEDECGIYQRGVQLHSNGAPLILTGIAFNFDGHFTKPIPLLTRERVSPIVTPEHLYHAMKNLSYLRELLEAFVSLQDPENLLLNQENEEISTHLSRAIKFVYDVLWVEFDEDDEEQLPWDVNTLGPMLALAWASRVAAKLPYGWCLTASQSKFEQYNRLEKVKPSVLFLMRVAARYDSKYKTLVFNPKSIVYEVISFQDNERYQRTLYTNDFEYPAVDPVWVAQERDVHAVLERVENLWKQIPEAVHTMITEGEFHDHLKQSYEETETFMYSMRKVQQCSIKYAVDRTGRVRPGLMVLRHERHDSEGVLIQLTPENVNEVMGLTMAKLLGKWYPCLNDSGNVLLALERLVTAIFDKTASKTKSVVLEQCAEAKAEQEQQAKEAEAKARAKAEAKARAEAEAKAKEAEEAKEAEAKARAAAEAKAKEAEAKLKAETEAMRKAEEARKEEELKKQQKELAEKEAAQQKEEQQKQQLRVVLKGLTSQNLNEVEAISNNNASHSSMHLTPFCFTNSNAPPSLEQMRQRIGSPGWYSSYDSLAFCFTCIAGHPGENFKNLSACLALPNPAIYTHYIKLNEQQCNCAQCLTTPICFPVEYASVLLNGKVLNLEVFTNEFGFLFLPPVKSKDCSNLHGANLILCIMAQPLPKLNDQAALSPNLLNLAEQYRDIPYDPAATDGEIARLTCSHRAKRFVDTIRGEHPDSWIYGTWSYGTRHAIVAVRLEENILLFDLGPVMQSEANNSTAQSTCQRCKKLEQKIAGLRAQAANLRDQITTLQPGGSHETSMMIE